MMPFLFSWLLGFIALEEVELRVAHASKNYAKSVFRLGSVGVLAARFGRGFMGRL
jgi:hypothetical protein